MYEDINSGGEDLSAHQLTRAVYYGDYFNDFQYIRKPKAFWEGTYELDPRESDRSRVPML